MSSSHCCHQTFKETTLYCSQLSFHRRLDTLHFSVACLEPKMWLSSRSRPIGSSGILPQVQRPKTTKNFTPNPPHCLDSTGGKSLHLAQRLIFLKLNSHWLSCFKGTLRFRATSANRGGFESFKCLNSGVVSLDVSIWGLIVSQWCDYIEGVDPSLVDLSQDSREERAIMGTRPKCLMQHV